MSDDSDIKLRLTAGEEVTISAVGKYYRVISAVDNLFIAVDDGPLVLRPKGTGQLREKGFSRLRLMSETTQSVIVSVTDGRVDDGRLIVPDGTVVQVDGGTPKSVATFMGVTDANGVGVIIEPSANTNGIRIFSVIPVAPTASVNRIVVSDVAPTGLMDYKPAIYCDSSGSLKGLFSMPVTVEAGKGVFFHSSASLFSIYQVAYGSLQ